MRVVHLASSLLPTVPRVGTIIARICTLQWRLVRGWADLGKVPASSGSLSSRHILGRCSVGPPASVAMEARWGVELWDCVDQVLAEVAANNTFLSSTCSKYIRSRHTMTPLPQPNLLFILCSVY